MKNLYKAVLEITADIEQIEKTIKRFSGNGVDSHYLLRTEHAVSGSCVYAKVRTSNYVKLLHAEKNDLEKSRKLVESKIKDSL